MEDRIANNLNNARIRRQDISLSGGDPLHPQNVPNVLKLAQRIRVKYPGKSIWVRTDYKLGEFDTAQTQIVDLINALVNGEFV